MRYLFLLRGLPGSGKSTFVQQKNLEAYTISPDQIRLLFESPVLDTSGNFKISQKNDKAVWQEVFKFLEGKMSKGELVVIDATHTSNQSFKNYKKLIQKYRYRVFAVDFSEISLKESQIRNKNRSEYKIVPEKVLKTMHENLINQAVPGFIKVIKPEEFDKVLEYKIPDFSKYKKIHHTGDVQGTCWPLEQYFIKNPIQKDELYIFTGDYVDRGRENHLAVEKMLELSKFENVIFVEGNHDDYLRKWANNEEVKSQEFELRTQPQLEENGVSKQKVKKWLQNLRQMVLYQYQEKTVLVTHGGLSKIPKEILKISCKQLIRGVGEYDEIGLVDDSFAKNMNKNCYQIHGHRNPQDFPTKYNSQCFNLEGKVEFGGNLRIVTLDQEGFQVVEILNQEGQDLTEVKYPENSWFLTKLRNNKFVQERTFENNISSFNFSKKAFYKQVWNLQTVTARGLFLNTKTKEIVIRSYNKFFNLNEREETKFETLKDKLVFPLTAWLKEDGFLGLVGFDSELQDLIFASKSCLKNDFANWLEAQFYAKLKDFEIEEIKKHLKEKNCCLVFEVIQPENDPHIIEYQKQELILLDIIKRTEKFETFKEEEVLEFCHKFGFKFKEKALKINNLDQFEKWLQKISKPDYKFKNRIIEGFVVKDSQGFQFKIKLYYYLFWKQMGDLVQAYLENRNPKFDKMISLDLEKAKKFYDFVTKIDKQKLQNENGNIDIITLRKEFERLVIPKPSCGGNIRLVQ